MPANLFRGDYEQLAQIAQRFGREQDAAQRMLADVQRQVSVLQSGDWVGQGAQAFYAEMNSAVLPSLKRLAKALQSAQRTAAQISREIKQAEDEAAAVLKDSGVESKHGSSGGRLMSGIKVDPQSYKDISPPNGLTGEALKHWYLARGYSQHENRWIYTPGTAYFDSLDDLNDLLVESGFKKAESFEPATRLFGRAVADAAYKVGGATQLKYLLTNSSIEVVSWTVQIGYADSETTGKAHGGLITVRFGTEKNGRTLNNDVLYAAVHEIGHEINYRSAIFPAFRHQNWMNTSQEPYNPKPRSGELTPFGLDAQDEWFADNFASWVYPDGTPLGHSGRRKDLSSDQEAYLQSQLHN